MKKIVKNFNNLIIKTIFKAQNKTNNKFVISRFNKLLITFIGLLFFYLFYLLTPLLYDKGWVQTNIENKLLNDFKINISTSANISYYILPSPHFLIKDSKILLNDNDKSKSIAEIKDLRVFLNQGNFFDKEKINLKQIVIDGANFSLLKNDFNLLNQLSNKHFSDKKIKIKNSSIFFKNDFEDIISIIKINRSILFFDKVQLLNFFNLEGQIFNLPFIFNFKNEIAYRKNINVSVDDLGLNISNESNKISKNLVKGKNSLSFFNSKFDTEYKVEDKITTFKSNNSIVNNSRVNYNGVLTMYPFDLDLNINLNNYKILELFNQNSILGEFIKSGLLHNSNVSIRTSIISNANKRNKIFQSSKINFRIKDGLIDFNNTLFINDKIGSLRLDDSNLFFKDEELILKTDIFVDIQNLNNLFSFLNTGKLSRKKIKNILINLDYNFMSNEIEFNRVTIDNIKVSDQFLTILETFDNNNTINTVKIRRLLNKLINIYEG